MALDGGEAAVGATLRNVGPYQRRIAYLVVQNWADWSPICVSRRVVVRDADCSGAYVSAPVGAALL